MGHFYFTFLLFSLSLLYPLPQTIITLTGLLTCWNLADISSSESYFWELRDFSVNILWRFSGLCKYTGKLPIFRLENYLFFWMCFEFVCESLQVWIMSPMSLNRYMQWLHDFKASTTRRGKVTRTWFELLGHTGIQDCGWFVSIFPVHKTLPHWC